MMFLREEQNALLQQLGRRSASIADIYFGGLRALADEPNPYRYQLAAHAFREVIAHCLRLTGEAAVFGDGMKQRLVPVRQAFTALKQASQAGRDSPANLGGLSDALNEALEGFFDWQESNRPQHRIRTAVLLAHLSGPGPSLPSDVVASEISAWMDADEYFKKVAHNGRRAERDEFVGKLFAIEDILLRRMQPRPLTDLDEIDALLAEADYAN